MPILTAKCQREGLVVPVVVGVSVPRELALKKTGKRVPDPVKVVGLIDTGASQTAIDAQVVEKLNLSATGSIGVSTISKEKTPRTFEQFDVILDVVIPPQDVTAVSVTIPVISVHLETLGVQILLGRDVLRESILIYNGQTDSFSAAF